MKFNCGGGGVQPHFSPRHTEIWIWGWAKLGKKVFGKRGKQTFYFKIEKIPIFSHDVPKFGFGDGKKCEKIGKKYMEREGKSIRFNKLLYIIIIVFCILNKIFRSP